MASAPGTVTTWNIDPAHSGAEFKVKHLMISNVKGKFSGLSGVLKLDEGKYEDSSVEATIPVATATGICSPRTFLTWRNFPQ